MIARRVLPLLASVAVATPGLAQHPGSWEACGIGSLERLRRDPSALEMRCRFGATGPGRFGLHAHADVPVYRPDNPLPGTHLVGIPGLPHPAPGESYEAWEWRVLRTVHDASVRRANASLAELDPVFLSRILDFERALRLAGVRVRRTETHRTERRQAWLFQQGRSRPGPIVTGTLTSWHCRVDRLAAPPPRAADYRVERRSLERFHAVAAEVGLHSYGADSNDPGHVFLPDVTAVTGTELAVLRTLARVAPVSLATGRPEDEPGRRGMLPFWRERTREFLSSPPRRPAALDVPVMPPPGTTARRGEAQALPGPDPASRDAADRS
jgi:hypothetical protein